MTGTDTDEVVGEVIKTEVLEVPGSCDFEVILTEIVPGVVVLD